MKDGSTSELRKYLAAADLTNKEALNEYSTLIQGVELCDSFFSEQLLKESPKMGATQGILAMQARMLLFSATRMALSGHAAATLPLLRTSLEAACYSYMVGHDSDKETIWLNRHKSEEAGRACRRAFTSAVTDAAKLIEAQDGVSVGTQQLISGAYQASIDFGAHPNPKSVLPHLRIDKEREDGKIEVGLHHHKHYTVYQYQHRTN
ncbi:hypothetical protein [Ruegeria faecimaris]|uniref:hypothetical protein n=1 Tax=Ruegeria faecimaris TaxID=686389 RepID=UPI0024916DCB|nr:hypothetical protein [Ruegeria faecimaris]